MTTVQLTDSFVVDDVRRTADGYLTAFARVARTGIQEYRGAELGRPELDKVRVYRPEAEVFNADALRSFAHRPVTLKHPPVPVTAKNWRKYAGGQTSDEVVRDGEFVRVPLVMMDQGLIDAYEKDGVRELSMGYSTDIQWRTGVTDAGEEYDAVQTAIRGNHLAVVPVARGGKDLRIGDEDINDDNQDNEGDDTMAKSVILDGFTVQVVDDNHASIITRVVDGLTSSLKSVKDEFEAFKKKSEEDDEKKEKALKDAQTAVQTKDGEIAVLKKSVEDAKITPAKLDELVKDRVAVIDAARPILGDKYVFDGKDVGDIRKDAVSLHLGDAAKNLTDAAIEGAFLSMTMKDGKPIVATSQISDALRQRPGQVTNVGDEAEKAYDAHVANLANRWKGAAA
jgi:hypothetical protein